MVVYNLGMRKRVKNWLYGNGSTLTPRARAIVLPVLVAISAGAVIYGIISVVLVPRINPAAQRGVGANGFQAYVEDNGDLGISNVVSKSDVETVLSGKAKTVSTADISKVFNLDGNRGQTVTYSFKRSDNVNASLYVDLMSFKNQQTLDDANVTQNTTQTSDVSGHHAYYMHAQTLGAGREYRLMVVDDLKVYKFVIVQPVQNITINEVAAIAALKKLALKAHL